MFSIWHERTESTAFAERLVRLDPLPFFPSRSYAGTYHLIFKHLALYKNITINRRTFFTDVFSSVKKNVRTKGISRYFHCTCFDIKCYCFFAYLLVAGQFIGISKYAYKELSIAIIIMMLFCNNTCLVYIRKISNPRGQIFII